MVTITKALRGLLNRVHRKRKRRTLADELDEIALRCASRPVLDDRSDEEILGYDSRGRPG